MKSDTYEEIPNEWRNMSIEQLESLRDNMYERLDRISKESMSFKEYFFHNIKLIETYIYYRYCQENPDYLTGNDMFF